MNVNDYLNNIDKGAFKFASENYSPEDDKYPSSESSFSAGALSLEAREYWLNQFKQNNDLYIALMLKQLYTEEEVFSLLIANTNILLDYINDKLEGKSAEKPNLVEWFKKNKKYGK
jgi:hypothetical protein